MKHNSRLNCWNKNLGPELNLGFRNYEEGDYAIYENANSEIARKYGEGKYYVIACAKNRGGDYRRGNSDVIRIEVRDDYTNSEISLGRLKFDGDDLKIKVNEDLRKTEVRFRLSKHNSRLTCKDKKNLGPELNLGFRNYEKGDYAIYENANSEIARKYGEGKYYVIACAKQYLITPSSLVDRKRVRYGHSDVIRIEVEEDSNNSEIP
ncbi:hypothetical protein CSB11_02825 [Candidatus Campbellbacteria bacterium]|nr:MAG: hypothetical protein CSB11_02825 [Candidatus Campbellbacteria bacterium]